MNGQSLDIIKNNLDKLQTLFPDIFSEGKIDFEKFKATFSDDINFNDERYVLNWAGKADAFKTLQMPTTATLKLMPKEGIDFDNTQNVFIEGENLEVLKVLQKSYYDKVKCIIIDPPYNTGNDYFTYPDNFKEGKANYEKRIGDKDEEGFLMKTGRLKKNSKDNGHYHSNWLNMIYPRLFLAKNLLKENGIIFIHIDDNEIYNLRLLMNEIFGEENFIAQFIWQKGAGTQNDNKYVAVSHEYVLCFAKNLSTSNIHFLPPTKEMLKSYNQVDEFEAVRGKYTLRNLNDFSIGDRPGLHYDIQCPDGTTLIGKEHRWRCDVNRFNWRISEKRIVFEKVKEIGEWQVFYKQYINEKKEEIIKDENGNILSYGKIADTLLLKVALTGDGTKNIKELFGDNNVFSYPKPVEIIKHLLKISTKNNDTVLDFFAGSGTTAQAVLELNKEDNGNRKFILVQLPEITDENSEAFKAGYKTIADISKERIRRVINKLKVEKEKLKTIKEGQLPFDKPDLVHPISDLDLGFKSFKLVPSNFKIWRGDEITEENLVVQLDAFINPAKEESIPNNMLYELILKAGYLLTDDIQVIELAENSGIYYSIKKGELVIVLKKMSQPIIDAIIKAKPQKVITLDNLFAGNDQLKTNTVLQMKDAGIDLKTI